MDPAKSPTPCGGELPLATVGEAGSWRLPDGVSLGGPALDPSAARRSAAFLAGAVAALKRTQARRF